MLITAHKITTGLMIALGLLHVSVTFVDYDTFYLRELWFAGAGVTITLAGFLYVVLLRDAGKARVVRLLCMLANVIFAAIFAVTITLMQNPQVFVGLTLFIIAAVTSLTSIKPFENVEI